MKAENRNTVATLSVSTLGGLALIWIVVAAISQTKQAALAKESLPIVRNVASDASVKQVKEYLASHLNDAASVQYVEWSAVYKREDGFLVRCKYRAKNSFGAYVLANQAFLMDATGAVFKVVDWKDGDWIPK